LNCYITSWSGSNVTIVSLQGSVLTSSACKVLAIRGSYVVDDPVRAIVGAVGSYVTTGLLNTCNHTIEGFSSIRVARCGVCATKVGVSVGPSRAVARVLAGVDYYIRLRGSFYATRGLDFRLNGTTAF